MFQFLGAVFVQDQDITVLSRILNVSTNLTGPAFTKPNHGGKQTPSIGSWPELGTAILELKFSGKMSWQKLSPKWIKVAKK